MADPIAYAFLHGGGQGGWVWDETIAALKLQSDGAVKTFALDIPGCGVKRGRDIEDLTPSDVAQELIADLEGVGMKDIVLVGHSLAGNVMPRLAEMRPDLFRRLVYVSCSIPAPGQTVMQLMGTGLHGENDAEVGWPLDRSANPRNRAKAMFCNDMNEAQTRTFLSGVNRDDWPPRYFTAMDFDFKKPETLPATYVLCLRDGILPVPWQEKFAMRFGASRIVRVDAGHQVMTTRPHALAEILRLEAEIR